MLSGLHPRILRSVPLIPMQWWGRIRYRKPRSRGACWELPRVKHRTEAWQELAWQLPARTTSGTSEQKSIEMPQRSQSAGSERDGHNVKLSLKPSASAQQPANHTLEISAIQRVLGRMRRKRPLSITPTECCTLSKALG